MRCLYRYAHSKGGSKDDSDEDNEDKNAIEMQEEKKNPKHIVAFRIFSTDSAKDHTSLVSHLLFIAATDRRGADKTFQYMLFLLLLLIGTVIDRCTYTRVRLYTRSKYSRRIGTDE